MKTILILFLASAVVVAAGIAGVKWLPPFWKDEPHTKFVFVVEATKSVTTEARNEAFAATEKGAEVLKRGDSLTVIPLTGDAATEAGGKVFRQHMPTERKAFENDLKEAKKRVRAGLEEMRNETAEKPFVRTDLFGSLKIAAEERKKEDERFALAILSDMIQDTPEMNFMTNPQLANEDSARKLALSLMKGKETMWSGARVFLGQLRSEDLKKLDPKRREAIRAFWLEFFKAGGAVEVIWATDGAGQLEDFLRRAKGGEHR